MSRFALALVCSCFLFCSSALAQVSAIADAPKQVDVGDLIVLDASKSTAATFFEWVPVNTSKQLLLVDGGKRAVTAIGKEGAYTWVLITAGAVDGKVQFASSRVTVIVGAPVPDVVPPPPGPPAPPPAPAPDAPSAELQALVTPLKAIMAKADQAKAKAWAEAWVDFHTALKAMPAPPATLANFQGAVKTFMNAAGTKLGLAGAFPGFTVELNKAFEAKFGTEDGALDPVKAAEFTAAVVWACKR